MKVLIVNTTPFGPGGITTVILSYYKNMKTNSDVSFDIVAINDEMPEMYANVFNKGLSKVFCLPRRKNVPAYIKGLYRLCKKNHYDVIHVHGNSGTMAAEMSVACLCGIPKRIAHCHTTPDAYACSNDAGEWIFKKNFKILKNAIDLKVFKFNSNFRKEIREKYKIADDVILLGHVGYFNDSKNQKYIVDLLKKIKNENLKVLFIGDGKNRKYIENACDDPRIIFCGSNNEVYKYISAMDLFVFPSIYEGLGVALIEAQASGLECLVSTAVPEEVNVAGNIAYLSLENSDEWKKYIMNFKPLSNEMRIEKSLNNINILTNNGYEIKTEAKKLYNIYKM